MRKTYVGKFQDDLEPDNQNEIHMQKYFLKTDINKMMNFLEKETIERKELNIIENKIE